MMMILLINMKFNIPVCFLSFTQQLFPPSAPPPSNVSHGADRRKQFYLNSFELWVTGCVVQTQHYQHLMAIDAAPAEEWGARASQKKASIKTAECHRNHPVSLILNAKNKSSSRQQTSQPKNLIPFASYLWLSLHFFFLLTLYWFCLHQKISLADNESLRSFRFFQCCSFLEPRK